MRRSIEKKVIEPYNVRLGRMHSELRQKTIILKREHGENHRTGRVVYKTRELSFEIRKSAKKTSVVKLLWLSRFHPPSKPTSFGGCADCLSFGIFLGV